MEGQNWPQEPWRNSPDPNFPCWDVVGKDDRTAFSDGSAGGEYRADCKPPTRDRILAAVNACAGIPQEQLQVVAEQADPAMRLSMLMAFAKQALPPRRKLDVVWVHDERQTPVNRQFIEARKAVDAAICQGGGVPPVYFRSELAQESPPLPSQRNLDEDLYGPIAPDVMEHLNPSDRADVDLVLTFLKARCVYDPSSYLDLKSLEQELAQAHPETTDWPWRWRRLAVELATLQRVVPLPGTDRDHSGVLPGYRWRSSESPQPAQQPTPFLDQQDRQFFDRVKRFDEAIAKEEE